MPSPAAASRRRQCRKPRCGHNVNRCELQANQDLIPEQEYDSFNGTGRFDVTDWLTVSFDGFYSKRSFYRKSAYSSATITVPQTNAFFVRPAGFTGTSYTIDYMFTELPARRFLWLCEKLASDAQPENQIARRFRI